MDFTAQNSWHGQPCTANLLKPQSATRLIKTAEIRAYQLNSAQTKSLDCSSPELQAPASTPSAASHSNITALRRALRNRTRGRCALRGSSRLHTLLFIVSPAADPVALGRTLWPKACCFFRCEKNRFQRIQNNSSGPG